MFMLMILVFILGYLAIAMEHPMKINKTASALLLAVLLWVIFSLTGTHEIGNNTGYTAFLRENPGTSFVAWISGHEIPEHLGDVSAILFFLLGAMTIVELMDAHEGFRIITDRIGTTRRVRLLWMVSLITFFLSAVLDNLTTAIVMIALLRKLVAEKKDRWFFAGMIIIAANSGGAFSPIGDVTTIMLWIGGQVTTLNIIIKTIAASLVSMVVPLAVLSFMLKGDVHRPAVQDRKPGIDPTSPAERNAVFFLGVAALLFVPVFKTITGLPPWLGMLAGLGVLWLLTEIMHRSKNEENKPRLTIAGIIRRVDMPGILFFLGILMAVAALQSAGHLSLLSVSLEKHVGNLYAVNLLIGLLSAVVDNVPLVAGAIGMYGNTYPADHFFWEMLAYCAGTGGSILIIGSAAGVAVMGLEKIDFLWYLRKISIWALVGYLSGALVYWLMNLWLFS